MADSSAPTSRGRCAEMEKDVDYVLVGGWPTIVVNIWLMMVNNNILYILVGKLT